jgi:hypothetical protein
VWEIWLWLRRNELLLVVVLKFEVVELAGLVSEDLGGGVKGAEVELVVLLVG